MKEITYFYLAGCPYCERADRYIKELKAEYPEFAGIPIRKIEERQNAALAKQYDYYFVPSLWIGQNKLFEGVPTKEQIRAIFSEAKNTR